MKRFRLIAFAAAFLLVLSGYVGFGEAFPCEGEITGTNVNLRAGNSRKYEVLKKLDKGDRVVVLALKGEYYLIKCPVGVPAYISARYLAVRGGIGEVTGTRVNVRARPVNGTVVCQVNRPAKLKVLEKKGDWYRIQAPAHAKVYVHKDYVRLLPKKTPAPSVKKTAVPSPTPKPTPPPVEKWRARYEEAVKRFDAEREKPLLEADFAGVKEMFERILAAPDAAAFHSEARRRIALCDFYIKQQAAIRELKDKNKELEEKLRKLREELERKLEEIAKEKAKKEKEGEVKFLATGYVEPIGGVINRPATHRLVKGGKVLYLLRSDTINLNDYFRMFVGVNGTISPAPKGWEADIINVTEIKILDPRRERLKPPKR
ncbi:MAG: hypothetical protein DRP90_04465 [Planctomycetota bacterium]|nr:MAG: hypothetical protein DRP90_04465 [Planctomycetota bacterium]